MNPNKKLHLIEDAIKAAEDFKQQGKIQESVDEYLRAAELLKTVKGNEKQYAGAFFLRSKRQIMLRKGSTNCSPVNLMRQLSICECRTWTGYK